MKSDVVTLEIIRRSIVAEGVLKPALPGDPPNTITVSLKRARQLLESRVCRMPQEAVDPAVVTEPSEKKSSGAPMDIPSTDSQSSSAPGTETLSSALAEAPVLPENKRRARRRASTPPGDESAS